jgi:hypothetical protein
MQRACMAQRACRVFRSRPAAGDPGEPALRASPGYGVSTCELRQVTVVATALWQQAGA